VEGLSELLALARQAPDTTGRVLALRGYWRLVGLAGDRGAAERLTLCEEGLAASDRPDTRKAGLAELARVPLPAALALADRLRADAEVRAEAELAALQIATALLGSHRAEAEATLRGLADGGAGENVRAAAQAALQALADRATYLMPWLAAGPHRQAGMECQALFDIPFGPELPEAGPVAWRPARTPPDPLLYWQVDLADVVAGDHAVAYIKTRVYVPEAQPARVAMGVDDGIKLWVNGELVHANNAVRGLVPDQDQVQTTLRAGWNDLLAKITQHTLGCGASVRLTAPDGKPIDGLRVDPEGK
jgi:hypothetical protein